MNDITVGNTSYNIFCTDDPLSTIQLSQLTKQVLHLPLAVRAIPIVFNVGGLTDLKFSPDALALIFQRNLTWWNDSLLVSLNPSLSTIQQPITVVRRSGNSASTGMLARYLASTSSYWTLGTSNSPAWPPGTLFSSDSDTVGALISNHSYSIGYTTASAALGLFCFVSFCLFILFVHFLIFFLIAYLTFI